MTTTTYPTFDAKTVRIAEQLFDNLVASIRQLDGLDEAVDAGLDEFTNQLLGGLADSIMLTARVIPQMTPAWGSTPADVHARAVAYANMR